MPNTVTRGVTVDRPETLGHKVQRRETIAAAQAAGLAENGKRTAVHDPLVDAPSAGDR